MRAKKSGKVRAAFIVIVMAAAAVALSFTAGNVAGAAPNQDDLNTVIAAMNSQADKFKNVVADLEWKTYTSVVQETEIQTGKSYFRRKGKNMEAMLDIEKLNEKPNPKQLRYKDGTVSIYEPKTNRITEHQVGQNKSDADAAMSLGFGGRGDELLKSYDVKWMGWETVGGVHAAKMELTGKTPGLQKAFNKAVIWLDPERDIAVQQQFFETSGDYRLIRYHNIKFNGKMNDDVFKLRTKDKPEIVRQ